MGTCTCTHMVCHWWIGLSFYIFYILKERLGNYGSRGLARRYLWVTGLFRRERWVGRNPVMRITGLLGWMDGCANGETGRVNILKVLHRGGSDALVTVVCTQIVSMELAFG